MALREPPECWPQEFQFTPNRVSLNVHPVLFEEMLSTGKEADRELIHPLIEEGRVHSSVQLKRLEGHPLSSICYEGRPQLGVFAMAGIAAGVDLGEYVGELQVMTVTEEASYHEHDFSWLLKNGPFVYEIFAGRWANELVFVNDFRGLASEPNVSAEMVVHRGRFYLVYRTTRRVERGEEILTDYGEEYWQVPARRTLIQVAPE